LAEFAYASPAGHGFSLGYRYLRHVPAFFEDFSSSDRFREFDGNFHRINQIRASARIAITSRWTVYDRFTYTFEESLLLKNQLGVRYTSKCQCWAGGVEAGLNRWGGWRVSFSFRLLGLGGPFERAALGDMGFLDSF
jgi:lipopolysaccharide assembly outer membrane protein LptD (OstA)